MATTPSVDEGRQIVKYRPGRPTISGPAKSISSSNEVRGCLKGSRNFLGGYKEEKSGGEGAWVALLGLDGLVLVECDHFM